jgi:ubiquinone/menaquinone biosynthesis C-methylase UbiE
MKSEEPTSQAGSSFSKWDGAIFCCMPIYPTYSGEPDDQEGFTAEFDSFYTRFAGMYDFLVRFLPIWRNWLKRTLPHIQGPRVLEVSFGTGYLLTQFADHFQAFGIDYNAAMAQTAQRNLQRKWLSADLQRADISHLPYAGDSFDTLVNTMAFSGYPDGKAALAEMERVLKPGGKLVMVDIEYPKDRNRLGMALTKFWMASGDLIRDMGALFKELDWEFQEEEIGGFGSVHLYVAEKKS